MERLELRPTAVVAGGDALARDDDGRVVFVTGALPGELVVGEVVEERRDYRRAVVADVLEPSPGRLTGGAELDPGCAACTWGFVDLALQRTLKERIVADALRRLGGVDGVDGVELSTVEVAGGRGFRTTVRAAVDGEGRACFNRPRTHELVPAAGCVVTHPLVDEVLRTETFAGASEVVVRASVATGEIGVLRDGRGHAVLHEDVAGRRFRVSGRSFFQAGPAVAEALVAAVAGSVPELDVEGGDRIVDLYAGVGLFASTLGARSGAPVTAVEVDRHAVADAIENVADLDATVVRSEVGRWRVPPAVAGSCAVVVADPARPGLGRPGVATVHACSPRAIVVVSCDAGSFGRDVQLFRSSGWSLTRCQLVDAFPNTPHVEVVSTFRLFTEGK